MITCEEASIYSRETYIPCGVPATTVVYHDRDKRSYNMCTCCAEHNLRNRGGKLISSTDAIILKRYKIEEMR